MISDMKPEDIVGDYREAELAFYDAAAAKCCTPNWKRRIRTAN